MNNLTPAYTAIIEASRKWQQLCAFLDLPHTASVLEVLDATNPTAPPSRSGYDLPSSDSP